ncbi:MAG: hypothetical protein HYZ57_19440 [Acidobacteria bacterium]|nr:hypothetical protein [Acidobacteriota bacterium]
MSSNSVRPLRRFADGYKLRDGDILEIVIDRNRLAGSVNFVGAVLRSAPARDMRAYAIRPANRGRRWEETVRPKPHPQRATVMSASPITGQQETEPGDRLPREPRPAIPAGEVRAELERILTSPVLMRSRRLGKFLRFTIEEALQGRQANLKEYLVGVEVFNKLEGFDPRIDSIVRVEARRLRSKLEKYYEADGRDDPIVIQFKKGSYVPVVLRREELPRDSQILGRQDGRSIAVMPFSNLTGEPMDQCFCDGLAEDLISQFTKLDGIRVVARSTALPGVPASFDGAPAVVLEGSVRRYGDRLRVSARLIDVARRFYLWSETYERDAPDVLALQDEISRSVIETLKSRVLAAA